MVPIEVSANTSSFSFSRLFLPKQLNSFSNYCSIDKNGFVIKDTSTVGIEQVISVNVSLIVAPPWLGKTFVASKLFQQLSIANSIGLDVNFKYHNLTQLDRYNFGTTLVPNWWSEWSTGKGTAIWIIDSLDEGEEIQKNICLNIFDELKKVKTQLDRLTLVMLAREAELPKYISAELEELFGKDFNVFELLKLDYESAAEMIGVDKVNNSIAIAQRNQL